ncbi:unnamed protein product, partial [Oppiella nova]
QPSNTVPLILFVIVLYVLLSNKPHVLCAKCPAVESQSTQPCFCRTNSTGGTIVVCNGDTTIQIKNYFQTLSHSMPEDTGSLDELVVNNTAITSLEEHFLSNITFKRITIKDALSLNKISANAFGANTGTVDEFVVVGESQIGTDTYANELFDALSSLTKARKIWLDRNKLTAIPSVAFGKISGADYRLNDLNFNTFSTNPGFIRSIGNYAFYYLNRLRHLYLSHQRIDYIPANAFDFERPSNQTLYVYLGNNRLNNTSFERGVLLNAKRPVHLELYWNHKLTYLDEKIFAPFLMADKRNTIRLGDNPLACDCKSYWMVRDKDRFKEQISNVKCKVGPNKVFSIDLIPFDQCNRKKAARDREKGAPTPQISQESHVVEEILDIQPFTNNKRLTNEFKLEETCLGAGSYGVVIKGTNKIDEKPYAIKLIYFVGDEDTKEYLHKEFNKRLNEIRIWAKVGGNTCVQYRSSWLESEEESRKRFVNYVSKSADYVKNLYDEVLNFKHFAILHIQMDFCLFSLKEVLHKIRDHFETAGKRQLLPPVGYYIAAELLVEILQALHNLHSLNIIHRDVKPSNILIKYEPDQRFIRLADFGLAVEHKYSEQSHTKGAGADRYMAPEVKNSRRYNLKADIYSMGVVIQELFNFDINTIEKQNNGYQDNYVKLTEITNKCLNGLNTSRPSCHDMLKSRAEWTLPYNEIKDFIHESVKTGDNNPFDPNNEFIQYFLRIKYETHECIKT